MTGGDDTLLVGLGSPYGDDQVGWLLVDAVHRLCPRGTGVRCARAPLQLLDWLDGVERLVICDASQGRGAVGSWRRWHWPAADLQSLRAQGSHDLGLAAALTLAETLGQFPTEVSIWAIEGAPSAGNTVPPNGNLSVEVAQAVSRVAAIIAQELNQLR